MKFHRICGSKNRNKEKIPKTKINNAIVILKKKNNNNNVKKCNCMYNCNYYLINYVINFSKIQ